MLHQRGIRDLLATAHTWQRYDYDNCYPFVLTAKSDWGGDNALCALAQSAQEAGHLSAVHANYTDFYPNTEEGPSDALALEPDGRPRTAWFNQTTDLQAHLLSLLRAPRYARQFSSEIHRRYGMPVAFVDVVAAVPPWEKTDHNARYQGCACFKINLQGPC